MPRYTVAIRANDPGRWVPGAWTIDVASKDPAIIFKAARELCETENVTLIRVVANSTGKEVKE